MPHDELSGDTNKTLSSAHLLGHSGTVTSQPGWACKPGQQAGCELSLIFPGSSSSPTHPGESIFSLLLCIPWKHSVESSANRSQSLNRVNKSGRLPGLRRGRRGGFLHIRLAGVICLLPARHAEENCKGHLSPHSEATSTALGHTRREAVGGAPGMGDAAGGSGQATDPL